MYSISGDGVAPQFFYIDPDTGVISLKKLLTLDSSSQYTVFLHMYCESSLCG